MKVLRHEENDAACPITCNGAFDTAWSKTMVGHGPEDQNYALELTYNYGVDGYERGTGLQAFVVFVPSLKDSLAKASQLGLATEQRTTSDAAALVIAPDGYVFELHQKVDATRAEWVVEVVIAAVDPESLAQWYVEQLGMKLSPSRRERGGFSVGFEPFQVQLVIVPTADGTPPQITAWEGRNAIAMPEQQVSCTRSGRGGRQ